MPKPQTSFFPKGILIDLDGTLADSHLNISTEVKNTLSALQKYIPVSLCTGRLFAALYSSIMPLFPPTRVHIVAGGGQLVQSDGTILWESKILSDQIKEIAEHVDRLGSGFVFGQGQKLYCNSKVIGKFQTHPWNFQVGLPNTLSDWSSPLLSIIDLNEFVISYIESIENLHVQKMISSHGLLYFDITTLGVEKGSAVKKWSSYHKIDLSSISAVGDNLNDLGILNSVGHKVVVRTAPQEVLNIADEIIGPPEDGGITRYLQNVLDDIS